LACWLGWLAGTFILLSDAGTGASLVKNDNVVNPRRNKPWRAAIGA